MKAEEKVLNRVEKSNHRYNIFKAGLVVAGTVVTVFAVSYYAHRIQLDNLKTRQLISCSVNAFTASNYKNSDMILKDCLERTK